MFSEQDLLQMKHKGIDKEVALKQIENFRNGFPFLSIVRPVCIGDGLESLPESRSKELAERYDRLSAGKKIVKFVPASGAATRMFKDLYEYLDGKESAAAEKVCSNIDKFAFYERLKEVVPDMSDKKALVEGIIGDKGLGYGSLPKGLLLFHRYDDGSATPFEEHLVEGAIYASSEGVSRIHFTVSPEHKEKFEELARKVLPEYEKRYGIKYEISYSEQKPSTDTIAVNEDFTPFRNSDGSLLFRPAGHGALLANLDDIDADIVFIKTIDNVTHRSHMGDTVTYKKALAAILLDAQSEIFALLDRFEKGTDTTLIAEAEELLTKKFAVTLPDAYNAMSPEKKAEYLKGKLDRPIRVCGMVRNEGEPGGGPFFARNADGSVSLQIAESSQIAPEDKHLMQQSTHFNPVDLVCGLKNHKSQKFELKNFIDHSTGFISKKSKDGKDLLAQELPGLWNGSMSDWNTLFVEVPITTFNPVKVVADLLRPAHLA